MGWFMSDHAMPLPRRAALPESESQFADKKSERALKGVDPELKRLLVKDPDTDDDIHTHVALLTLVRDLQHEAVDYLLLNSRHHEVQRNAVLHGNVSTSALKRFSKRDGGYSDLKNAAAGLARVRMGEVRNPEDVLDKLTPMEQYVIRGQELKSSRGAAVADLAKRLSGRFTKRYTDADIDAEILRIESALGSGRMEAQEAVDELHLYAACNKSSSKVIYERIARIRHDNGMTPY